MNTRVPNFAEIRSTRSLYLALGSQPGISVPSREILLTDESWTLAMQARERLPTLRQPPLRPYGSNEMLLPRRVLYPGLRLSASRFGNAHDFRDHRIAVNEFPSLPLQCGM